MKPRFSNQQNSGLTFIEVLVIIVAVLLLAVVSLTMFAATHRRTARIGCVSNLKQLGLAIRIWENDNSNDSLMAAFLTNSDNMGLNDAQRAWVNIMGITNQPGYVDAKILCCPDDTKTPAFTVSGIKLRISYFLNIDATETYPQMLLSGDDNLMTNGVLLRSGMVDFPSSVRVSWTKDRHRYHGNIGFADGSVSEESASSLQNAIYYSTNGTPFTINRLAIP